MGDEVPDTEDMFSGLDSRSVVLLVVADIIGLAAVDGFSLADLLWAYELKTSGVENGA